MQPGAVFGVLATIICASGGILAIICIATPHWTSLETTIRQTEGGTEYKTKLEITSGLFKVCLYMNRRESDTVISRFESQSCATMEFVKEFSDLENKYKTVRGLVIFGLIVCGVAGVVIFVAVIVSWNGGKSGKIPMFIGAALLVVAFSLTLAGSIVYAADIYDQLKHSPKYAGGLALVGNLGGKGGQVDSLPPDALKSLQLDHNDLELSWSFINCIVALTCMPVAVVLAVMGAIKSGARQSGPEGVVYSRGEIPGAVIIQQPTYPGHYDPYRNAGYVPDASGGSNRNGSYKSSKD